MDRILSGARHFQDEIFPTQHELFERLANGQRPLALFITCADSRVHPNLITQTDPGDLFILRNAGNIVPPFGVAPTAEAGTIEYAVSALGIRNIIVCGHSNCGAMRGLLEPQTLTALPAVASWLHYADTTRRIAEQRFSRLSGDALLTATVEQNVLVQIENLRTHPSVAAAVIAGELNIFAWMYRIESGEIFAYRAETRRFERLGDSPALPSILSIDAASSECRAAPAASANKRSSRARDVSSISGVAAQRRRSNGKQTREAV